MEGQEHEAGDCPTLLNGVVQQLEHEQGKQQHDGSLKQTYTCHSPNRLSRKLSRRTNGLEQDFTLCEKKPADAEKQLLDCQKENSKLQQELSEVSLFKNKLADLLKRENEEKSKLEKQQSTFQNQAFTAIFERDRLLTEVEQLQFKEDEMTEKISDLQDRLDQLESRFAEEKSAHTNLQNEFEKSSQELAIYRKVIEKFWRVRVKAISSNESESCEEKATMLLDDDEGYWSFGDLNKLQFDEARLAKENLVNLQHEYDLCSNSLGKCQAEYLEEKRASKHFENAYIQCRQHLVDLTDHSISELQQLNSMRMTLKEDFSVLLNEERNDMLLLQEAIHNIFEETTKIVGGEGVADSSTKCSSELIDNHVQTCCKSVDPCENKTQIEESANGSYFHDNSDNIMLDKVELSTMNAMSPVLAVRAAGDDELTKSILTTCNEIVPSTHSISSLPKETFVLQDDASGSKDDVTDSECLTVAMDYSEEAVAQFSQDKVPDEDLIQSQDATDGNFPMVAAADSKEALALALQEKDGDINGKDADGECLMVAMDDSRIIAKIVRGEDDEFIGKREAKDDDYSTNARDDRKEALTRALQEKDNDLSSTDDATNDECLTVAKDESKVAIAQDFQEKEDDLIGTIAMDDSKEALAQALQEKVAALLLLSQQEERHILEYNNAAALEDEISALKQQLLQVTSEKVRALLELAQAHEKLRNLHENSTHKGHYKSGLSSGQLTPVEDRNVPIDKVSISFAAENAKRGPMQNYLKHLWQKGPELGARTKSLSHMLTLRSSKEADPVAVARLRVENATLRESLGSIRHLCKSANRLRLTVARVAADSDTRTETTTQAAVEAVDGVITEALHLKVALHSSLPADDLGWNSIGSPLTRASEGDAGSSNNLDANDDVHIVCVCGLEIVRLLLLAAQLQKRCLEQTT